MILRALFLFSLFVTALFAEKVLYINYEEVPKRVIKGQVFEVTLKTLSTIKNFKDIDYEFFNHPGIEVLSEEPARVQKGKFFYDTFTMYATSKSAKLPNIIASLVTEESYPNTVITGEKLNVISLNPQKNFSNLIANSFALENYKTTSYDNKHNIVVFSAVAQNSVLKSINFKNVFKQGVESLEDSIKEGKITYFVVIDKKHENFSFSYFNLLQNRFVTLNIPIVVEDDSVVTQTDLKPTNQTHEKIKIYIALGFALLITIIAIWQKTYILLLLTVIPAVAIYFIATPKKEVCIKQGAAIQLLPMDNGTIFEITNNNILLIQEGKTESYVKVRLKNEKIGWVKNEDTCAY